jgi:hypothetical protein
MSHDRPPSTVSLGLPKHLAVSLSLLLPSSLLLGLDISQSLDNTRISRDQLGSLLQILLRILLVLQSDVAQRTSVQGFSLLRVGQTWETQGSGSKLDGELRSRGGALESSEGSVGEQRDSGRSESLDLLLGRIVGEDGVLVNVSEGFLVLVEGNGELTLFELADC